MEPAGAPSAFERQNITVSAGAAISRTGTPSAAAALKTRAPSMWTLTPRSWAPSADFANGAQRVDGAAGHVVGVLDFDQAGGRPVRAERA